MQSAGYRIIPVNPGETEVLGEKCYARLEDIPEQVDIVDIFRRSEFVPASLIPRFALAPQRFGCRKEWCTRKLLSAQDAPGLSW